ncbi:MAG: response regulator [Alphaproteobacteria bacterium]|jgi:two-component system phosphate regulon response regulator PhoB|nr:response regulator [Alphaproteobacteria bacterium]
MSIAVIADDEINQIELISYHLEKSGFKTLKATNGDDAYDLILENNPDISILDWMMPNSSGISVCRRVRSNPNIKDTPIIILSARGEDVDATHGLSSGADDYIVKPFSPIELIARVNSLLRRTKSKSKLSFQQYEDIYIDHDKKIVQVADNKIKIGKIEYKILSLLLSRPEHVFSRDQIIDNVWNNETYIDDRTVDVHMSRLRKNFKENYKGTCNINTVHGFGYSIGKK